MTRRQLVRSRRGTLGTLVSTEADGTMLVEVGEELRSWRPYDARPIAKGRPPVGVAKMNARDAEAIRLRDVEGLSYEQIAARLGATLCAVRGMMRRVSEARQEERNMRHLG